MSRFLLFGRLALLLLVQTFTGARPAAAQAPTSSSRFDWAQIQQAPLSGGGFMATDAQGNLYVLGSIRQGYTVQLDNQTLFSTPGNSWEVYLAKLSPAGRLLWVKRGVSQAGFCTPWGLTVDGLGNVFVTGQTYSALTFSNLSISVNSPYGSGYLAKFDSNGQGSWIKSFKTSIAAPDFTFDLKRIRADGRGNCLLVGMAWKVDSLGTLPLVPDTVNTGFVALVNGNGTFAWVRQILGEAPRPQRGYINHEIATDAVADSAGNVYVGGSFPETMVFSPTVQLTAGDTTWSRQDGYVAKYSPQGALRWVRQLRSADTTYASGTVTNLATDHLGNLFVAGRTVNYSRGRYASTFAGLSIPASGYYVAKLDAAGSGLWQQSANTLNADSYANSLLVDAAGNPTAVGGFHSEIGSAATGTIWIPGNDLFAARFTATGQSLGLVMSGSSRGPFNDKGAIGAALGATGRELFMFVYLDSADVLGTLPINVGGESMILTKVDMNAANAHLGGSVYLDLNANGRRDSAETPFPRQVWVEDSATRQVLVHYADAPTYGHDVAPGAYALRARYNHPYYHTTQPGGGGAHRVNLPTAGLRADTLDFGLAPIPGLNDLRITLTPYTPARPGRVCRYRATVQNVGTTTLTGQATVTLSALGTVLSATPTPSQQQGHTLTWNFQNLPPFGARAYDLAISLPTNLTAGTLISSSATVTPLSGDQTPADNSDAAAQSVITSWDPNDLAVNFSQLTPVQISAGQPLDYTVRFENFGTDTAFTVIIQDTLPASLLQLGTIDLVSQSHNCRWTCTPAGLLTVRFPNIGLPNQATNAFFSQGFARFRVVPRTTLAGGQLIPNRAHIVFDYNAPLPTNQATTVVSNPTGLLAAAPARLGWTLYPNPAAQQLTLTGPALPAPATLTVRLLDALGRPVRALTAAVPAGQLHHPLDLTGVPPGLYFVEVAAPGAVPTRQRLVVEAAR